MPEARRRSLLLGLLAAPAVPAACQPIPAPAAAPPLVAPPARPFLTMHGWPRSGEFVVGATGVRDLAWMVVRAADFHIIGPAVPFGLDADNTARIDARLRPGEFLRVVADGGAVSMDSGVA